MGEILVVRRLHSIGQPAQDSKKAPPDSFPKNFTPLLILLFQKMRG
jgi:hypothetical protein